VRKETGRWKCRWKIRGLLADKRCRRAVLDFLTSADVRRQVPAEAEDRASEASEAELREWVEGLQVGAGELGVEVEPHCLLNECRFGGEDQCSVY